VTVGLRGGGRPATWRCQVPREGHASSQRLLGAGDGNQSGEAKNAVLTGVASALLNGPRSAAIRSITSWLREVLRGGLRDADALEAFVGKEATQSQARPVAVPQVQRPARYA
jgi:hypothetical protein